MQISYSVFMLSYSEVEVVHIGNLVAQFIFKAIGHMCVNTGVESGNKLVEKGLLCAGIVAS
jgi:hypothetical protein